MGSKRRYKRGYPTAVLVGFEDDRAVMWKVFSNVIKLEKTLWPEGNRRDAKAAYNFYESIVNALRPTLREGVRSIILASQPRTDYTKKFVAHINAHHAWLNQGPNKATFSEITGSAGTLYDVATLTRRPTFREQISETTSEETRHLVDTLEKHLNAPDQNTVFLYSLEEIEEVIFDTGKTNKPTLRQLMLTNKYLSESHEKKRIHRLLQVANNKNVKTRIIEADSDAGKRLTQLGGIVFFA